MVAGHHDALVGEFAQQGEQDLLADPGLRREVGEARLRPADQPVVDPAALGVGIEYVVEHVTSNFAMSMAI